VASQTTQNTAVAEQDYTETDLSLNVVSIAGQQNVSLQAILRGVNVDRIIMQDLAAAFAAELDRQVLVGTGANNQLLGIYSVTSNSTAITVTSSSVPQQLRNVADAVQRINTARKLPPTHIICHPRRWGYWSAATDSNGRPLVVPEPGGAPQNTFGGGSVAETGQVVGRLHGLPVLTDPQSTTNDGTTDAVVVARMPDEWVWLDNDGIPAVVEFTETLAGQLTTKIVCWGMAAATWERYSTASVVLAGTATGMGPPVF
jgi:HK97 family phage major capsid protein